MKMKYIYFRLDTFKLRKCTFTECVIMGLLQSYGKKEIYLTQEKIADILNINIRTVERAMKKLYILNYIAYGYRKNKRFILIPDIKETSFMTDQERIKYWQEEERRKETNEIIESLRLLWCKK